MSKNNTTEELIKQYRIEVNYSLYDKFIFLLCSISFLAIIIDIFIIEIKSIILMAFYIPIFLYIFQTSRKSFVLFSEKKYIKYLFNPVMRFKLDWSSLKLSQNEKNSFGLLFYFYQPLVFILLLLIWGFTIYLMLLIVINILFIVIDELYTL